MPYPHAYGCEIPLCDRHAVQEVPVLDWHDPHDHTLGKQEIDRLLICDLHLHEWATTTW